MKDKVTLQELCECNQRQLERARKNYTTPSSVMNIEYAVIYIYIGYCKLSKATCHQYILRHLDHRFNVYDKMVYSDLSIDFNL